MEKKTFKLPITFIIFIIFLILKLDGIIDWKWIWIFSPFWIAWIIEAIISLGTMLVLAIQSFKPKNYYKAPSGPSLVWDNKTSTLYGPWSSEEETE